MKNKKLLFGLVVFFLVSIAGGAAKAQDWISLGPDNVSGRSRAIVFDRFNDKVIYAGGVAGGLYVSVNDGKNWQELDLGLDANLAVTAIAQDNNGVIYVGTGEAAYYNKGFGLNNGKIGMLGGGVYKSNTPSNKEWANSLGSDNSKYDWISNNIEFTNLSFTKPEPFNNGDGKAFINSIAVNRQNNKVYVGTHGAGLFLINEDASNWENVSNIPAASIVEEVKISSNGNIAVCYNDGELKVSLSQDDFQSLNQVFGNMDILNFDADLIESLRYRVAFGIKNPDKLYVYAAYYTPHPTDDGYITYKDVLYRTEDINDIEWKQTTPASYSNANGDYESMSLVVDDRNEMEAVYLGGSILFRGYDANNSDIYYWESISRSYNSLNDIDGVRTSPSFVSQGVNEIIIKENPQNAYDSTFIAVATNGGIHTYSSDSMTFTTRWRLSTKNMITSQFYSVAVAPDASVVGGTEANGIVYIHNPNELGTIKNGDVIWTINSPGYNPSTVSEFSTSGGGVAASQFERKFPTPRKSFILSRPYLGMARTYGDNGQYASVNDQTWDYGQTLFYSGINDNPTWTQFEADVTPMLLWESVDARDAIDSVEVSIDDFTTVNGIYDPEWREGSWIEAGDSILCMSYNMDYPFWHTFDTRFQYVEDTVIKVQNPVQSRLFFANSQAVYVSHNINDYVASPLESAVSKISFLRIMNIGSTPAPGGSVYIPNEKVSNFGITKDGNTLFFATEVTGQNTSRLYRYDLTGVNFQAASPDKGSLNLTGEFVEFPRVITSIDVDKNDGNNVMLTFGSYISAFSNIVVSTNALVSDFSTATFSEVVNRDIEEEIEVSQFIPSNKPVFASLIESVSNTSTKAYIGAEDGIYYTPNFKGSPSSTEPGKIEISWKKIENIPNIPVFDLVQQTMRLPSYEFYNRVGQNVSKYTFLRTEYPGAIYAATYGKGIYAYLGDAIEPNENMVGIESIAIESSNGVDLKLFPNPATTHTTVQYNLSSTSNVSLELYDINGRRISTLNQGSRPAGLHSVEMDCSNLNKGVYMVRIISNSATQTSKLVIQ